MCQKDDRNKTPVANKVKILVLMDYFITLRLRLVGGVNLRGWI